MTTQPTPSFAKATEGKQPNATRPAEVTQTYIKTKSGYVRRLGNYEGEPRIYRIIRFRFNGNPRTIRNNVTLTEARNPLQA